MATSEYTLKMMAQVVADANKIQSDINKSLSGKISFVVNPKFDSSKIQSAMADIQAKAGKLKDIKIFGDEQGNIQKAIIGWSDGLNNTLSQTVMIDKEVKATVVSTQNLEKAETKLAQLEAKRESYNAQIAKDMDVQSKKAESFLAKYEFMTPSTQGDKLKQLAEGIKNAASSGNIQQVNKLSREFDVLKGTLSAATGESYNLGKEMGAVIRRTLESAATLGLMYGALNQLRQGIEYIKDLDKELTNVQVVTGMSQESVENLGMEYNTLAKEMGATTLEVARGSLEFLRQGKTIEETSELVKSSMILSKLGNLEAAQSTEYLTSTLNGFKLEAKDASDIIDKLIVLDNNAATSAGRKLCPNHQIKMLGLFTLDKNEVFCYN